MKAKIFFLLAAIMLSCVSAFAQSGPIDHAKGDVNGDGELGINDVNALINVIGGGSSDEGERSRADVNEDGEINVNDVNALIDLIAGF